MITATDIQPSVWDVVPVREKWLKTAIKHFVMKIKASEKNNLIRVVLYGSVARGDYRDDSDIDVFVLVENGNIKDIQDRIFDAGFDISMSLCEAHDRWISFSPLALSLDSYASYPKGKPEIMPIYQNIAKDGIYLYDFGESEDNLAVVAAKKLEKAGIHYDVAR